MALKPFVLREYIAEEGKLKTIEDDVLGTISYGVLTVAEALELKRFTDPYEHAIKTLWYSLRKADPSITEEQVREAGDVSMGRIMELIGKAEDFRVRGSPA